MQYQDVMRDKEKSKGVRKSSKGKDRNKSKAAAKQREKERDAGGEKEKEKEKEKRSKNALVLYIQTEYCEQTLREVIRKESGGMNPTEIWRRFRQIVEGLVHIHGQGIIHRYSTVQYSFVCGLSACWT